MTTSRFVCSCAALAVLLALEIPAAPAQGGRTFTAQLTTAQEVQNPPVATDAQGQASFRLRGGGTELTFTISVSNIENVRDAHLHLAPAGQNGMIVVGLFSGSEPGPVNGVLVEGTITAGDLVGPLQGLPLSVLIDEIRARHIYVNVHTEAFPAGEIRGQVRQ
jgi:hypothetical protein